MIEVLNEEIRILKEIIDNQADIIDTADVFKKEAELYKERLRILQLKYDSKVCSSNHLHYLFPC